MQCLHVEADTVAIEDEVGDEGMHLLAWQDHAGLQINERAGCDPQFADDWPGLEPLRGDGSTAQAGESEKGQKGEDDGNGESVHGRVGAAPSPGADSMGIAPA